MAFSVINHWFRIRRGLALGLVAVGSAVGGVFFSLILKVLFTKLPWTRAVLVLSAVLLSLLAIGNVLVKRPTPKRGGSEGFRMDLSCFKSLRFWLLCYTVFGKASRND